MPPRPIAMPPRFKCAVGGEWKLSSEFSQNQLKLWTQRKRHDNDGITSANIGLVCKAHNSGPQLAQVKCQGPCGLRKHREAFSKRQRNQPDAWCIKCTEWKERYPGDVAPGPAPNTPVSPAELAGLSHQSEQGNYYDYESDDDDDDGDDDDDDDDEAGSVLESVRRSIFQGSHRNTEADEDDEASEDRTYMSDESDDGAPKKTRTAYRAHSTYQASNYGPATTDDGTSKPTRRSYAAARPLGAQSSVASLDSREGIQSFASSTVASEDTRPLQRQTYNAFDPHGNAHIKTTGEASENSWKPPTAPRNRAVRTSRSGWAKGDNRKKFEVVPNFASMPEEPIETYDSSGSSESM